MTTMSHGQGAHLVATSAFDAWHLLTAADVARVAWLSPEGVSIVPVNCVAADGALWFRTTPQSAIAQGAAGTEVAVEADYLDPVSRTGWSVVLRAVVQLVDPELAPESVSQLCIWPEGQRNVYVRLEPTEVSGRRLVSRPSA